MKICISSSMVFYDKFTELKKELENKGHAVLAPEPEFESREDIDSIPDHEIWVMKGNAISAHFRKIDDSDCLLITNYEKKGIPNYIGANTFLEMGYAYGTGKFIYVLHDLPEVSTYLDEILGMRPILLRGDISQLQI